MDVSKAWYPVIDYSLCTECGKCTSLCQHQVYDSAKAPVPVVIFPDGCVQGCHGCGKLCVVKAISYVGDKSAAHEPRLCDCGTESENCCG